MNLLVIVLAQEKIVIHVAVAPSAPHAPKKNGGVGMSLFCVTDKTRPFPLTFMTER